jgi:hypothetical protein
VNAGSFARINFNFDFTNLTRLQDFREVHGCAPSARGDGLDVERRVAVVLDIKSAGE